MSRRVEVLIGLLLLVTLAIVVVWGGGPEESVLDIRPSTLHSGPDGSKGVYDVLARLGVAEERRRRPLFDLNRNARPRPAVLAVLNPPLRLETAELAQVVRFVRGGGTVLSAGSGGGITRCVGWGTANAERFVPAETFPVVPPAPGLHLPPVADYLRPLAAGQTEGGRVGVTDEEGGDCDTLAPVGQDTLLRLRNGRPAALRLRYRGGGRIVLVADAGYFRNRVWRMTDAPQFVTPLLVPVRAGPLVWDEYHQGYAEGGSTTAALASWLTSNPVGLALLQLAAVVFVALAVAGVRFGPPRVAVERRRRSPLEHMEALAAGFEGAGGAETAVALTVAGLRRRLGRGGPFASEARASWLAALELGLRTPAGRNAVRRLQRTIDQPGGPERALAAAQAVEDVWEELRPRTMHAAS